MVDLTVKSEVSNKRLQNFSKYLCYTLRHKPESIGLVMDKEGWVLVDDLILKMQSFGDYTIDLDILKEIVSTDSKQRYSFKDDFKYIRANQGHSIPDLQISFKEYMPSGVLYHGTATRFTDKILKEGLKPMSRQYVHLSRDIEVAKTVGQRHGNPEVLTIDALAMARDGYKFYESDNGVILVNEVPTKYLS